MVARFFNSLFSGPRQAVSTNLTSAVVPECDDNVDVIDRLNTLRTTVREAGRELPNLISSQLRQIDDVLGPLAEYIAANGASTEQEVFMEAVINDYIPTPLKAFLAASENDRHEDSSATGLLADQLKVLFDAVQDFNNQVRSGAIAELSTYSTFLGDKFGSSLFTPGGS